jgi:hypothetical protein
MDRSAIGDAYLFSVASSSVGGDDRRDPQGTRVEGYRKVHHKSLPIISKTHKSLISKHGTSHRTCFHFPARSKCSHLDAATTAFLACIRLSFRLFVRYKLGTSRRKLDRKVTITIVH